MLVMEIFTIILGVVVGVVFIGGVLFKIYETITYVDCGEDVEWEGERPREVVGIVMYPDSDETGWSRFQGGWNVRVRPTHFWFSDYKMPDQSLPRIRGTEYGGYEYVEK
jgi:hypothetical protein